jgi:hypothetical protein
MQDDKLASPVISTYAVGSDSAGPRRGAGLALPVMVILGTASVAAIVSVSFDGSAPITADQAPRAEDAEARQRAIAQRAGEPRPNVSVRLDGASFAADESVGAPRADRESQDLPLLSVLQPNAAPSAARDPSSTRARPAGRPAAPRARPAERHQLPPASLASSCGPGCDDAAAVNPAAVVEPAGLEARLSQSSVPLAADDYGELAVGSDDAELIAPDIAQAPPNEQEPLVLLADSRPATSAGPTGPLATTPALEPAPLAAVETRAEDFGEPIGEAADAAAEREGDAAAFEPSVPPAGALGPSAESSAAASIPEHLARIGERYAAVTAVEPAVPDGSAIVSDAAETEPPALAESSVSLDLGEASDSSVIVQDDELVAIRLGDLVTLLEDRLDHPLYVWMSSSAVASKFVTAETLAAAGIRTRYDPQRRQLVITTTGE